MEFERIREIALIAIAADDTLCDLLVLKGGNALELVHRIGHRGSLDLDFSMEGDIDDQDELKRLLTHAVEDRFDAAGLVVFDSTLEFVPRHRQGDVPAWWGGYKFRFKIIPREIYKAHSGDLETLRRQATVLDGEQHRVLEIQISRGEYCSGSVKKTVEGFELRVYTLTMIACEKLRAICQQMSEYQMNTGTARTPRARDFYDIHVLIEAGAVRLVDDESLRILRAMFAAKRVKLELLRHIGREREFHRQDWPRVMNAVRAPLREFEFYYDSVIRIVEQLEATGVIDSP